MFEIEYKGANCVVINTKKAKLVVDPKLSLVGLKDYPVKNCVQLVTEDRFMIDSPDTIININGPGEYGVSDFDIKGIAAQRHIDEPTAKKLSTLYRIEINDSRIGVLGNIYEDLSDDQLEELGVVDILIIPVGGNGYTLDAVGAASLVRSISPKVVIPVHYQDKKIKYEVPQGELELFTKELGVDFETMAKYKSKQITSSSGTVSVIKLEIS